MFRVDPLEFLLLALEILLTDKHMGGERSLSSFVPCPFTVMFPWKFSDLFLDCSLAVSTVKVTPGILSLFSPATADLKTGSTGASPMGSFCLRSTPLVSHPMVQM